MRVLVCDPIDPGAVEQMKQAGLRVDVRTGLSPEQLKAAVGDYEAMVVRSATKVTADIISAAAKMKIIVRGGVGLDNIDCEAAEKAGIVVRNTPGASSISVAELAIGLMFAISRFIPQADASMKAGRWEKKKFTGYELYGKTCGILGFGRIGVEVARRTTGLGMKNLAWARRLDQKRVPADCNARMLPLEQLLPQCDYISIHLPLNEQTHYLINAERIGMMKDGVRIVNCSRGGVVDEAALAEALASGKVAAAAVDVFEKEPPEPDNPLLKASNVVLTPHLGASAKEGQARVGKEVAKMLIDFASKC